MMEAIAIIFVLLALFGSIGALACFLQMLQEQREDWAHDRLVGWESARIALARQVTDDENDLRVFAAKLRVDRLGGLHCPIHGQEAYRDGGRVYFESMRTEGKKGELEVKGV